MFPSDLSLLDKDILYLLITQLVIILLVLILEYAIMVHLDLMAFVLVGLVLGEDHA
jgi:hypothetical protein